MKTHKLPETKLRDYIKPRMDEDWMMTWHEDREISPGVPDLHYVMKGSPEEKYRVGWLELKATDSRLTRSQRIGVEPSQHQYLRRWLPYMPIHFLVCVQTHIYVVPGEYSKELATASSDMEMKLLSVLDFPRADIQQYLPRFLREITRI